MKTINAKIGNMRKIQNWVVYPTSETNPDKVVIQCDNRIASFDRNTGEGALSDGKGGHQGFHKLHIFTGAKRVTISQELLKEIINAIAKPGDRIGGNVFVA